MQMLFLLVATSDSVTTYPFSLFLADFDGPLNGLLVIIVFDVLSHFMQLSVQQFGVLVVVILLVLLCHSLPLPHAPSSSPLPTLCCPARPSTALEI